ncbi:hypothetical protein D3C85_1227110 [compost metagenome]
MRFSIARAVTSKDSKAICEGETPLPLRSSTPTMSPLRPKIGVARQEKSLASSRKCSSPLTTTASCSASTQLAAEVPTCCSESCAPTLKIWLSS